MKLLKVYLKATVRLVRDKSVCWILFAAGIGHYCDIIPGLEGSPSWVLGWSRASHHALSFINPTIDYHAGGDAQVDIHRLEDASLFLSAHLFDAIAELAPILDAGISSDNRIKAVLDPAHAKEHWQRLLDSHQLILNLRYVRKPY
jgi:hypothetical protein